jgi:probable sporulation protein (polysaccharide deacetylase family)
MFFKQQNYRSDNVLRKVLFPIYQGNPNKPIISFMVNVAWGNEYLPQLLTLLKNYNITLTFFLQGTWVAKFPKEFRRIKEAGHEIGNHAYTHPDMRTLSEEQIHLEISKTNQIIEKEIGIKPQFFTPPYGYFDQRVINLAAKENMHTILWSLDTLDWKLTDPKEIASRIVPNLKGGSIILMHPTESSIKALPIMLDEAHEKLFKVGTITEVLSAK